MGLFDKIGDVIGDVVDGVVDIVDDVFGIDLKKVLDNDVVKFGLMAVSIFTGGVAIANGVMTGFSQATAAKGFMNTFVEGAKGFVSGVAQGFANPVETFNSLGETAAQAGTDLGSLLTGGSGQETLATMSPGSEVASTALDPSVISDAATSVGDDIADVSLSAAQGAASSPEVVSAKAAAAMDPSAAAREAITGGPVPNLGTAQAVAGAGGTPTNIAAQAGKDPSIWSRISDAALSPAGMQTIAGAVGGYADAELRREEWDRREEERRRVRDSWINSQPAPRQPGQVPSLQALRDDVRRHGIAAQAKYGY